MGQISMSLTMSKQPMLIVITDIYDPCCAEFILGDVYVFVSIMSDTEMAKVVEILRRWPI